jgi:hypothetical protein
MGTFDGGDEGVGMSVIVRRSSGDKEEGRHVESKRGQPRAQSLGQYLQDRAEGEHGAQVEVLAEVGVGEGRHDPASKRGAITDKYELEK